MTHLHHNFSQQTEVRPPLDFDEGAYAKTLSGSNYALEGAQTIKRSQTYFQILEKQQSLEELLANAVAEAKRWTSEVAMRLSPDTRRIIFRQLDRLHDADEWFEGDRPINLASYKSFVRAILSKDISGRPAFALSSAGILSAIWLNAGARLIIEFFPDDRVRYLVTRPLGEEVERVAGETRASRLTEVLHPFDGGAWFNGG